MEKEYEKINSLKELIEKSAQKYANQTIYQLEDKKISYKEMQEMINSLGTSLMEMNLKDKRIAIISENRYEWEISCFAICCGIGTVVPIDKSLTKTEIQTIIDRAEVQAIFCSGKYEPLLSEIKKDTPFLTHIISFDKKEEKDGIQSFEELIKRGKEKIDSGKTEFQNIEIDNEKTSFLLFTSGTTQKSKAVQLSHKNVCANLMGTSQVFPLKTGTVALSVLPLNHVFEEMFCLTLTIYYGLIRIHCNNLEDMIQNMNQYEIGFMGAVPAIYEYLYKRIDEMKKENIQILMCGGAKLDSELEQKYWDKEIKLVQGYGMTETSPIITLSNIQNHKIGSIGKPLPNLFVKIENQNEDGIGEIVVKGPNVMLGYYKNEEATKEVLKDEWLHTGDLARIDKDGYVFFEGRIKNMLVLPNGKKIFPEELESLINKIEDVKESFVFTEEVNNGKIIISAKIVCEDFEKEQEIRKKVKQLNEILPIYKAITKIYVAAEEILKTPTGKIKRNDEKEKIKKMLENKSVGNLEKEEVQDIVFEKVKEILVRQLGIGKEEIQQDSMLTEDLGADSLDKVEIMLALEKEFKVKILRQHYTKLNDTKKIIEYIEKELNVK